jgi:hypothetical protein
LKQLARNGFVEIDLGAANDGMSRAPCRIELPTEDYRAIDRAAKLKAARRA